MKSFQIWLLVQQILFRYSVLEICRQIGESSEKSYKNDEENGGTDLWGEIKVTKNPEPRPGNDFREHENRPKYLEGVNHQNQKGQWNERVELDLEFA